jgi:hypothetical protein
MEASAFSLNCANPRKTMSSYTVLKKAEAAVAWPVRNAPSAAESFVSESKQAALDPADA